MDLWYPLWRNPIPTRKTPPRPPEECLPAFRLLYWQPTPLRAGSWHFQGLRGLPDAVLRRLWAPIAGGWKPLCWPRDMPICTTAATQRLCICADSVAGHGNYRHLPPAAGKTDNLHIKVRVSVCSLGDCRTPVGHDNGGFSGQKIGSLSFDGFRAAVKRRFGGGMHG